MVPAEKGKFKISSVEPQVLIAEKFPLIDSFSPQFAIIYNQALNAELLGMSEIAGLGFRKALEFVVKDYCIHLKPDQEEQIKKEWLKKVIDNRLTNNRLKQAAEKAAWLGNDEGHYVRRWVDHDIQDLKRLIRMTVNGMNEQLEFDGLMTSFEDKEPK